jgi:thiol-disulfide isomerase/thioredoxin
MASAFLAGLAVGLLWSPCAGPILGAIFSINIAGHSAIATGALLAAYGSGCALMLGLLVIGGRTLVTPLRAKSALMAKLRQGAGVAMLAAVILNATGMTSQLKGANGVADRLETALLNLAKPTAAPVKLQPVAIAEPSSQLPSLSGGTGWLNGDPVTSEALQGKVVLIDFWTWDCINCQHTLPHVRDWATKYQSQGLVVIGVHTPEYPWEKPLSSVQKAVTKWQLPYRVVTDNNYQIWNAFGNQYWPAHYYFDAKGQLRYTAFGEGDYEQQEKVIQQLLKEARL